MKANSIYLISVLVCLGMGVPVRDTPKKATRQVKQEKFIPKFNPATCKMGMMAICNDTLTYPTKTIQKLVKRKKNLQLFSDVSLIEPAEDVPIPKMRDNSEPNNLCRTQTVTIVPKAGYDYHSGEQRFIINIKDYVQTVVYETCVEPDKECIDKGILPFGRETICKQKYNIVRLVSLTKEGNVEYGKFMVPSTCVCSYLHNVPTFF
ncbi:uncharacterized protein LOC126734074 [Anthonomus grandis grandis]|uniref:uncharacterized protein LOC126734074 n=1 Tax=Anthonomus grandis grandis TaxID=2921223 RepID=UPI0021652E22|nr:uncharacterized protein LOC126734074 [Anthonomus grandis grandis]